MIYNVGIRIIQNAYISFFLEHTFSQGLELVVEFP